MILVWCINSLKAVLSRLNEINVNISQILSDNFLRLYCDKNCGWEKNDDFLLLFHLILMCGVIYMVVSF